MMPQWVISQVSKHAPATNYANIMESWKLDGLFHEDRLNPLFHKAIRDLISAILHESDLSRLSSNRPLTFLDMERRQLNSDDLVPFTLPAESKTLHYIEIDKYTS